MYTLNFQGEVLYGISEGGGVRVRLCGQVGPNWGRGRHIGGISGSL